MNDATRITIKISKEQKAALLAWMKKFKISKDHFLRSQLPKELEYLKQLPVNPPIGRKINQKLGGGTERLNISLSVDLANQMDRLCDEKGIHREIFLHYYFDFLLNGDDEFGVKSPLKQIEELLENPRLGYSTRKHGNPYRHLHWNIESAKEYNRLFSDENE